MGQPMKTLERDAPPNTDKVPLPIAWTKTWTGNNGKASPILHFTKEGSAILAEQVAKEIQSALGR